jgi:putative phage-type endonuclease
MSFTIIEADQRSAEWFQARLGRLTGSRAADMLATIKSGEAAARRDLRTQLVVERLTGLPQEDSYINSTMQRGIDLEPAAFDAYERETGLLVRRTGFLAHDTLLVGCSLDGDVDNFVGIVEIKCPKSATHMGYLKSGAVPATHRPQIIHNLWVTGAEWCDFVSYDDRFPEHLRLFHVRVMREPIEILAYEKNVLRFLEEVQAECDAVMALKGVAA